MNSSFEATVTSVTRRYIEVCDKEYTFHQGLAGSRSLEICVGDKVTVQIENKQVVISSVAERENLLLRSYSGRTKTLVANLDHLLIVSAVGELFNPVFIDRIGCASYSQNIPYSLIVNKVDLVDGLEQTKSLLKIYENIPVNTIRLSAKSLSGVDQLTSFLNNKDLNIVALAGVSGVGKSTLLNKLVPDAQATTSAVSKRTGQGRQTTTQAYAHLYQREGCQPLLVVDLPGVQNYGITHLSKSEAAMGFPEFLARQRNCKFSNCLHLNEPDCAIVKALQSQEIAQSRYKSYQGMLDEIEEAKPY